MAGRNEDITQSFLCPAMPKAFTHSEKPPEIKDSTNLFLRTARRDGYETHTKLAPCCNFDVESFALERTVKEQGTHPEN